MINYFNFYDENLNGENDALIEDYQKYIKMYYTENAKCPLDLKSLLKKEMIGSKIKLSCITKKNKKWEVEVEKPIIINLNKKKYEIQNEYENKITLFKRYFKDKINEPIYDSNSDKELKIKINEIKNLKEEIESIEKIFNKQRNDNNIILDEKLKILKSISEIKNNKDNKYLELTSIDRKIKKDIKEIYINEKIPSKLRIQEISKNLDIDFNNLENWLLWFQLVENYLDNNKKLDNLINNLIINDKNFKKMNEKFVIKKPIIKLIEEESSDEIKIKIKKKK